MESSRGPVLILSYRPSLAMDSLLSTYASSDDDDSPPPMTSLSSSASFFTSLPPPKSSSSVFSAITPPKSQPHQNPSNTNSQLQPSIVTIGSVSGAASLFNSLPKPRSPESETLEFQNPLPPPVFGDSNPKVSLNLPAPKKKVVQFKPPITTFAGGDRNSFDDEDEDEEENEMKKRTELQSSAEAPTVKSFLSNIPAPKNSKASLGALPTSGSGRRSIIDADIPSLKQQQKQQMEEEANVAVDDTAAVVDNYHQGGYVDGYGSSAAGVDSSSWYPSGESHGDYLGSSYGGEYESYGGCAQYENNWIDRSGSVSMTQPSSVPDIMSREMGKRRKTDIPTEIIEVKQDELMKNRPREDQVKTTGIAFGPSYQPVSSAKGKPSKLHKRKHQIGSLYFDMKQKEMELAERRSRGYLTKAETHAKYGW